VAGSCVPRAQFSGETRLRSCFRAVATDSSRADLVLRAIRYGTFFKRVWPDTHSQNNNNFSERNGRSGGGGAVHQVIGVAPSQPQNYQQHVVVPVGTFVPRRGPRTATQTTHRTQLRFPSEWLDESLTCYWSTHQWKPVVEAKLAFQQVHIIPPPSLECTNSQTQHFRGLCGALMAVLTQRPFVPSY